MAHIKSWARCTAVYLAFWLIINMTVAVAFAASADVGIDNGIVAYVGLGLLASAPHYDTEYGLYLALLTFGTPAILTWYAVRRIKRRSRR